MKATNNLNQDLKDEITEQNGKLSKLQIFFDDSHEILKKEREEQKKLLEDSNKEKDDQVETYKKERDKYYTELEQFKAEFQMKMTQVRLMEMDLEEKLAKAQEGADDWILVSAWAFYYYRLYQKYTCTNL